MSLLDRTDKLTGTLIGPYRLHELIGRGGMARVYRASRRTDIVALKVLSPIFDDDPAFLERFRREAAVLAGLRHPHILTVQNAGEADGWAYIATPLVLGGTLKDRMAAGIDLANGIAFVRQIADALAYAHRQGLVHRDVKPTNILIEGDTALLADFGIARLMHDDDTRLTRTGLGIGTPEYVSPEQGEGLREIDGRSDLYSLGIVLYEIAVGRVPFAANSAFATIRQHLTLPVPGLDDVPDDLADVLRKALAKDPADRFQTATAFTAALDDITADPTPRPIVSIATDTTFLAPADERPTRMMPSGRRRGVLAAVLAGLVIGGGTVALSDRGKPEPMQAAGLVTIETATPTATATIPPTVEPTTEPTAEPTPEPTESPVQLAVPTETPRPTNTPIRPTSTPVPPTSTAVPPTSTPLPTRTPLLATSTSLPAYFAPTNTPSPTQPPSPPNEGGDNRASPRR